MFHDYQIAYLRANVKMRERRPLSFLRQSVAYLLSHSARKIPHAAGITTFDVTPLIEYGRSEDRRLGKSAEKLSERQLLRRAIHRNYSAFFLKTVAHVLYHVPCMNGFLDYSAWRNGGTFYLADDINLSFTVHTKYGVIKPVVRNPHLKDLETVANEMRHLTRRARRTNMDELYFRCAKTYMKSAVLQLDPSGYKALWLYLRARYLPTFKQDESFKDVPLEDQLQVEDVLGATCTLANIGMMVHGHQTVTVIIPPEVSMWGIGDLHLAPAVVDGEVVPRYVVTVAATIDHRAIDGGDIFPFVEVMRRYIENPALIYNYQPGDPI